MVIFDLICENAHSFEGWFKNQDDFGQQQQKGLLCCPICASQAVEKKLSAPKLNRKSNQLSGGKDTASSCDSAIEKRLSDKQNPQKNKTDAHAQYTNYQSALKKIHQYIDTHYKDVGNRFADEAISMHKGEKEKENIRGVVSKDQLTQLAKEGVDAAALPPKPIDKDKLN